MCFSHKRIYICLKMQLQWDFKVKPAHSILVSGILYCISFVGKVTTKDGAR